MCTLSWTPAPDGYWVFFNRDERITRAPGAPPIVRVSAGVRILNPVDGDFGGTWIGVNDHGVGAALLNRYEDAPGDTPRGPISRGLLLANVLDARSAPALLRRLTTVNLGAYQPFTIAVFAPGRPVALVDWTGAALTQSMHVEPGLVRTSSGRDQREAERIRADVFRALEADGGGPRTRSRLGVPRGGIEPSQLRACHCSHHPERGPFSVCMHREEAATQSLTEIHVTRKTRTIRYRPGPPCVTDRVITRRIAAAGSLPTR